MEQELYERQLLEKLKKNRHVLSFLKKNKLDLDFVDGYSDLFEQWLQNLKKCEGCQGLPFCTQKIRGRVKNLYMDGDYLEETFMPCRYKKKENKELKHVSSYRFSHLSTNEYFIDLNAIELKNESAQYLEAYASVIKSIDDKKGVYLYGQPGVGKSYLCIGCANYYAKQGHVVSFVKVPQLVQECKDSLSDYEYQATILSHLKFSEILFLDDLGSESISQWSRDSLLFPALNYRMDHNLKTYFISNYTLEELKNRYFIKGKDENIVSSDRFMERIRALSKPQAMTGKSRR
ncbi:ATP-binding protein [Floccifex sp.]|uniref:ATP-binding protein n=1 Tax=Floccifex sp. TaxID=2815810 RepID=UPI002A74AAEC|nr:ATP-binding protein [Floccifex sp.]MDD7280417.1 ATP-binding protein [Erysipelotrichaceae bacterium]MDY2957581.1 ATP-binding protein [Floccifex sp.]